MAVELNLHPGTEISIVEYQTLSRKGRCGGGGGGAGVALVESGAAHARHSDHISRGATSYRAARSSVPLHHEVNTVSQRTDNNEHVTNIRFR